MEMEIMSKCKDCNHDCHCEKGNHIDEYLDYCPCDNCECKRTYEKEKEAGLILHETISQ